MIESIRLKSFRKHEDMSLDFDEKFNLIHGRNNAGKTTVFFAIEYCLFGGVLGFKKISQLTSFKSKAIGVELIFRSRNGDRFKLQRMHKLVGKTLAAKGFFTLKKLGDDGGEDDEESYIMASDFGDREEALSLKINELTGISKRFFETGIHFHQGTISEILSGSKKLDIVFGITAATTLSDIFKTKALEYEKELGNIDKVKIQLDQYLKEKAEHTKKAKDQGKKIEDLKNNIIVKEEQIKSLQIMKKTSEDISTAVVEYETSKKNFDEIKVKDVLFSKEFEELKVKYGSKTKLDDKLKAFQIKLEKTKKELKKLEIEIDNSQNSIRSSEKEQIEIENKMKNIDDVTEELKALTQEVGGKQELKTQLSSDSSKVKEIFQKTTQLEQELEQLQVILRDSEREKGDIDGMLNRRNSTKDKPKCEYCGAPIDPSKIQEEIKKLQTSLKELEKKITSTEKKSNSNKEELTNLRKDEKQLNEMIHSLGTTIQQIETLEEKREKISGLDLEKNLTTITQNLKQQEKSIEEYKKQLNETRLKDGETSKDLNTLETQRTQFDDLEQKINETKNELENYEKNLQKIIDSLISLCNGNQQNLTTQIEELKDKDSEFANAVLQVVGKLKITKDNFTHELITKIRDELKELILTKNSEITTTLDMLKTQLQEYEEYEKDVQAQIMKLDKEIAKFEKEINLLKNKEALTKKYRSFQNAFNEVQNIIRQNASKVLEQKILSIHKNLSADDEFEKVNIDSDNYSLSVLPKGIESDELYPAMVYQGGGHKLILGLSYKIALGDLIGSPPFLLIDEPTEFMDSNNRITLLSNLGKISDKSQILLITHQDVDKIQAKKKIEIVK
ncbi:MAG: AAA family ATPase [Promethearchaeota archaeon]